MKLKRQTKILILTTIVLLFALGANTLISLLQIQEEYRDAMQSKVVIIGKNLKDTVEDTLALGFALDKLSGVDKKCQDIVESYEEVSYCYIVDANMQILYHNDQAYVGRILKEPENGIDLTKEATINLYSLDGNEFYDIALPIFDEESNYLGAIRLGLPVQAIDTTVNELVRNSITLMLVCFIIAILLSFYLAITI